jgi:hypothetical protein
MIRVQFQKFGEPNETPAWIDGATLAVPAEPFLGDVDSGQGGITCSDIADESTIKTLAEFESGTEVYIESEDAEDCLDDTDTTTEAATRIWWRATVLGPEQPT